jgi:hypothetical protein
MSEGKVVVDFVEAKGWGLRGYSTDYSSVYLSRKSDDHQIWVRIESGVVSLVEERFAIKVSGKSGEPIKGYFFHCHLADPEFFRKFGGALDAI